MIAAKRTSRASDFTPLDLLIERLTRVRDALPSGAEADVRMRGEHTFAWHLCISFMRPLNAEKDACEGRSYWAR